MVQRRECAVANSIGLLNRQSECWNVRLAFMLCGALLLTACGQRAAPSEPTSEPTALTCPGGYSDWMKSSLGASIYPTRESVVEHYLEMADEAPAEYVIAHDGKSAWILREDGTAREHIWLHRRGDGFIFGATEAC